LTRLPDMPARMRERLAALEPRSLDIADDSAAHAGHAGARDGGHYTLTIVSPHFAGKSMVARHRMVYQALGTLMREGIHALALVARAPGEAGPAAHSKSNPKEA
jgi:BolA protein